jgi:hypothetical protein
MPVRPDGRVDLLTACRWIVANNQQGGQVLFNAAEWVGLLERQALREAGRVSRCSTSRAPRGMGWQPIA